MAYFDENGTEVEGILSPDEVTAQVEAAKTEVKEATQQEFNTKIEELNTSLETTKAEIEAAKTGGGEGDKDQNLGNLRTKLQETETLLATEKTANEERWSTIQKDKVTAAITTVAGNDADMQKKIEHEYNTTLSGVKAQTAEEVQAKVASAVKLATTIETGPSALDVATQGANRGVNQPITQSGKPITDGDKAFGNKLGLNEDDYKKYGNDPRRTK